VDPERRPRYRRASLAAALAFAANTVIKQAVRRPRPELPGLPRLSGTLSSRSYPSAHAATSFAAAAVLECPPAYALAGAIALTRPYLGVHYPSDVVAGAALGGAVAALTPR
jgi:membrane-associated phospholipid phosphatase